MEDLRPRDADLVRLWINTALLAALLAKDDLPTLDSRRRTLSPFA
ncbi:hypothetical protein FHT70_002903 [Rhizobium sp. BK049]|nr:MULTISPECIES: hypothetical protein [Rhizobium]MBB3352966.1 hypothetical protein [Rhizobium sp. BK049]